jgi:hypothetical protein
MLTAVISGGLRLMEAVDVPSAFGPAGRRRYDFAVTLVPEVPDSSEDHGQTQPVRGLNDLLITN